MNANLLTISGPLDRDLQVPIRDGQDREVDPVSAEWTLGLVDDRLTGWVLVTRVLLGQRDEIRSSSVFAWPAKVQPAVATPASGVPRVPGTIPVPRAWIRFAFTQFGSVARLGDL